MITKLFSLVWEKSGNSPFVLSMKKKIRRLASRRIYKKKFQPVSLKVCCEGQGDAVREVVSASTTEVMNKQYWGDEIEQKPQTFPCPAVYTAQLQNVTVVGGRSYMLCGNQCVEDFFGHDSQGRYFLNEYGLCENADGTVSVAVGDAELTTWERIISEGISLLNIANYNYFHFLVDTCARLVVADQIEEYRTLPIIVEQSVVENPRLSECLDAVNKYHHPIIAVESRVAYRVQRLIAVSTPCWMPFNLKPGILAQQEDFLQSKEVLDLLRETILERLEKPTYLLPKKIFISRKLQNRSRLSNGNDAEDLFRSYGYQVIYPETMRFAEQAVFFRGANYIAAAGGAALTNLLFCQKDTKVAIVAPKGHSSIGWSTYAALNGISAVFLSAQDVQKGAYDAQNMFELDLKCAEDYLIGHKMWKKVEGSFPYKSTPVSGKSPSRILFCAYSNMAFSNELLWDSHAEGFLNALSRNGSDVLCIRTNEFVTSAAENTLRPMIDKAALKAKIQEFSPQLIISYNNTLPGEDIFNYTNCPVAVYPADVPSFWAAPKMMGDHLERYLFFDTAIQIKQIVQKRYPSVKELQFVPFGYATDFTTLPIQQDINVSFVGSIGNLSDNFAQYFSGLEATGFRAEDLNQIKDDYFSALDHFQKDTNQPFQFDFPYNDWDSDRTWITPLSILLLTCTQRFEILTHMTDLGLRVYGWSGSWAKTLTYNINLFRSFDYSRSITLEENMRTYNRSIISLNLPHGNHVDGFSWRVCDILASNATLLSVKKKDLSILMRPYYKDFPMFETAAEARELAEKLLKEPAWRKEITDASHEMIDACCRFERKFVAMEQAVSGLSLVHNKRIGAKEFLQVRDYYLVQKS